MEENKITIRQALELTRDILNNIQIPARLVVQIGLPISDAIANLDECLKAVDAAVASESKNAEEVDKDVQS